MQGFSVNTVNGPTNGLEIVLTLSPIIFVSPPLDADVTISGNITCNIWCLESSMNANAGPQVVIKRINGATGALADLVVSKEEGVEAGTAASVHNFSATPTSTAFNRGDRIAVMVAANDIGTMASGFSFTLRSDGNTAGADGDTYVTFTETFSFTSEPAGSKLYLTTTAVGINPGSANEYEAWTTAGSSSTNAVTNTAAGWTAPIQCTETGGGTALEWYTKQLTAFTLGGAVRCNMRVKDSDGLSNGTIRVEIAVCNSDGTGATVWGVATGYFDLTTTDTALSFLVSGDDTSVADGQRLRIRTYIDDGSSGFATAALVTGKTITLSYNGGTGGAAGDTFLTFTQTLTEFVSDMPPGLGPSYGEPFERAMSQSQMFKF